jgi:hypothetical protein
MKNRSPALPCPETLYAAALYLTTSYAKNGCPAICRMVMQQFECIVNHPDPSVPTELRESCRKLHADWERIGAERELFMREAAASGNPDVTARKIH